MSGSKRKRFTANPNRSYQLPTRPPIVNDLSNSTSTNWFTSPSCVNAVPIARSANHSALAGVPASIPTRMTANARDCLSQFVLILLVLARPDERDLVEIHKELASDVLLSGNL